MITSSTRLTKEEREIVERLSFYGYKYIARNLCRNELYVYDVITTKKGDHWICCGHHTQVDKHLFKFIEWKAEWITPLKKLLELPYDQD